MRVALTQRVMDLPDRGERRDALDQAWTPLLESLGMILLPVPNTVADVGAWLRASGVAAILLTGGNDLAGLPGATDVAPERDRLESELLARATGTGMPVLGICRGMQFMGRFHHAEIIRVTGHAGVSHGVSRADPSPRLSNDRVDSYHNFGFLRESLPEELIPTVFAADGTVEAFRHRSLPQAGVMWHPERGATDPLFHAWMDSFLRTEGA